MHTVIHIDEMVPKIVWFTSAATHDSNIRKCVEMTDHCVLFV